MRQLFAICAISLIGPAAHADGSGSAKGFNDMLQGLDTENRGPSQAGARDCDKADAAQDAHFEKNMDNPAAAVFGGAKLGCTFLQKIAWKPGTTKAAPASIKGKGPPVDTVVAQATEFWASADDHLYVKVLSGGALSGWKENVHADKTDVSSSRDADAFHVMVAALANNTTGCFVVYGQLHETNLNDLDDPKQPPPSWSAPTWRSSGQADKLPCPKGAKAPTVPTEGAPAATYKVGDKVQGQWSDGQWYPGKIGAVDKKAGTYRVDYDDGDVSPALSAAQVKAR